MDFSDHVCIWVVIVVLLARTNFNSWVTFFESTSSNIIFKYSLDAPKLRINIKTNMNDQFDFCTHYIKIYFFVSEQKAKTK